MRGPVALVAAAAVVLAACGSGPTEPVAEPAYDFTFDDPAGDTVDAVQNPESLEAPDLLSVAGSVDDRELVFVLTFAKPVTPWTDRAANALDGFIWIDSDTTESTGSADPTHGLGVDFYLDLRDDGFGRVALVNVAKRRFERVDVAFEDTKVTITVPRGSMVTDLDGDARYRIAVDVTARGRTPIADTSPDAGFHRLEPGTTP